MRIYNIPKIAVEDWIGQSLHRPHESALPRKCPQNDISTKDTTDDIAAATYMNGYLSINKKTSCTNIFMYTSWMDDNTYLVTSKSLHMYCTGSTLFNPAENMELQVLRASPAKFPKQTLYFVKGVFSSLCIFRFYVFLRESSIFEVLNVD